MNEIIKPLIDSLLYRGEKDRQQTDDLLSSITLNDDIKKTLKLYIDRMKTGAEILNTFIGENSYIDLLKSEKEKMEWDIQGTQYSIDNKLPEIEKRDGAAVARDYHFSKSMIIELSEIKTRLIADLIHLETRIQEYRK